MLTCCLEKIGAIHCNLNAPAKKRGKLDDELKDKCSNIDRMDMMPGR